MRKKIWPNPVLKNAGIFFTDFLKKEMMALESGKIYYKIGEIARKLNISVETIRMYEHQGILLTEKTPAKILLPK